jgi:hypothetical protein
MAALSCFISRLGEKGPPVFKLLKVKEKFEWSEEADATFAELKQFLTSSPVLTAPKEGKTLLLYITATNQVVSTPSSWSARRSGMCTRSSDQYTSLARSSMTPKPAILRSRSCCTLS